MTIQIDQDNLTSEVCQKAHFVSRTIPDLETRLNNRAGDDEQDEVRRCIVTSLYSLRGLLAEWLTDDMDNEGTDGTDAGTHYTLELNLTTRKTEGKTEAIAKLAHAYIVASALSLFYTTMGNADAMTRFDAEAKMHAAQILSLIHNKKAPIQ